MQDASSLAQNSDGSTPRTDAWVWLSMVILAASLAITVFWFTYAVTSDPCASSGDQCVLAFFVSASWLIQQFIPALPSLFALIVLGRYAARGHRPVPFTGFAIFGLNVVVSIALLIYISTLPSTFVNAALVFLHK